MTWWWFILHFFPVFTPATMIPLVWKEWYSCLKGLICCRTCSTGCRGLGQKHMGCSGVDCERRGCSEVGSGCASLHCYSLQSTSKKEKRFLIRENSKVLTVLDHLEHAGTLTEFPPLGIRFCWLLLGLISRLLFQLLLAVARGILGMPPTACALLPNGWLIPAPLLTSCELAEKWLV